METPAEMPPSRAAVMETPAREMPPSRIAVTACEEERHEPENGESTGRVGEFW